MEQFADFLPFSEEVKEALDNYHIQASSLTIHALPDGAKGSLIGRVVWISPLLKIGQHRDKDAVHLTLMDADGVEITGTAWGTIALKFADVLKKDKIYKFSNVVRFSKRCYEKAKNDHFESRVIKQSIELRFSGVVEPELVCQDPFPDIDQSQFHSKYPMIQVGQVAAVVGVVTSQFTFNNDIYVCLSNGEGKSIGVSFGQVKLEELEAMGIELRHTVLGILGAGKMRDVHTKTTGDKLPEALFKTFDDTLLITEPRCACTQQLVIWRNQLLKSEGA